MITDSRGIQIQAGDKVLCIGLHGHTYQVAVEKVTPKAVAGMSSRGAAKITDDGVHHILAADGARDYMPQVFVLSDRKPAA